MGASVREVISFECMEAGGYRLNADSGFAVILNSDNEVIASGEPPLFFVVRRPQTLVIEKYGASNPEVWWGRFTLRLWRRLNVDSIALLFSL